MGIISNKRGDITSNFKEYFDPKFYWFVGGEIVLDDGNNLSTLKGEQAALGFSLGSDQGDYFAIHNNIYVSPRNNYNVHLEGQISPDYSEINWVTRTNPIGDYVGTSSSYKLEKAFYLKGANRFIVAAEYNTAAQYLRIAGPTWPLAWSAYTLPNFSTTATFYMVNNVFVHMKGLSNNILEFTTDLMTWTTSTVPNIVTEAYDSSNKMRFVYSGQLYALQGEGNVQEELVPWTSTDLITWTEGVSPTSLHSGLAGGNGIFIKSYGTTSTSSSYYPYISTDCINWTKTTPPHINSSFGAYWREIFFNEARQRFELHNADPDKLGNTITFYSTADGVSWTIHSKRLPTDDYSSGLALSYPSHFSQISNQIRISEQNLVDVIQTQSSDISENYDSIAENSKTIREKANLSGESFTGEVDVVSGINPREDSVRQITFSAHEPIDSVGDSGDLWLKFTPDPLFVAVQDQSNVSAASTDGITWTQGTLPLTTYWYDVEYGNDIFVAVSKTNPSSAISTDGISWTQTGIESNVWNSISHGNDIFLALAYYDKKVNVSTDGITWISGTLPQQTSKEDIVYANGVFVIVSSNSSLAQYSTDGITWSTSVLPTNNWYSIAHGNGIFVAINDDGVSATSTDAITWTANTVLTAGYYYATNYGNGTFITLRASSNEGALSTDGVTWTPITLPDTPYYWDVEYNNNTFVAVTNQSISYASTDGITWTQGTLNGSPWRGMASNAIVYS
jgi:hypothetical protein